MAFETTPAVDRLLALLAHLVKQTYVGVPNELVGVSAYVTVGSQRIIDKGNQLAQRDLRLIVTFAYAVDGDEESAEEQMWDAIDEFVTLLLQERRVPGSALESLQPPDMALVDEASYQNVAAEEFRRYPIAVTITQQANY